MHTTPAGGIAYTDDRYNAFLNRIFDSVHTVIAPHLDLDIHHNATHTQPALLELLAYCGIHEEFVNDGAKTHRLSRDHTALPTQKRSPNSRALGRHLRGLEYWTVTTQFDHARTALLKLARTARLLPDRADIAIDTHDWLYYGRADTPMVGETHYENGTDLAFKYVTACLVTPELRLTLAAEPITTDSHLPVLLEHVLGQAAEWVDIRRVYLDRGFYETRILQVLEAHDLDYVVRARRFPSLAPDDGEPAVQVEHDYPVGGSRPPYDTVTVSRFCVPHAQRPAEKQSYFVTNLAVDEDWAPQLANAYRRRWGIETSYRVIKDFLPRCRSTYFVVRLFYFLFAVMLYNLWVVVNALLTLVFTTSSADQLVTAGVFGRVLRARWLIGSSAVT
jgi:hypothetical protein